MTLKQATVAVAMSGLIPWDRGGMQRPVMLEPARVYPFIVSEVTFKLPFCHHSCSTSLTAGMYYFAWDTKNEKDAMCIMNKTRSSKESMRAYFRRELKYIFVAFQTSKVQQLTGSTVRLAAAGTGGDAG